MSLNVVQGDAYTGARSLVITVTDEAGAAVDLSAVSLRFMVKRKRSDLDSEALISRSTTAGITIANPQTGTTKGVAHIALTSTETNIQAGMWLYELEATDSIGIVTLAAGRFIVASDLIQDA